MTGYYSSAPSGSALPNDYRGDTEMGLCDAESNFQEVSPMVQTVPQIEFAIIGGKQITGDFEGGDIATDGGRLPSQCARR